MSDTIKLTKEQELCVNFSSGDLLIKGVAGSGKSYVVMKRAKKAYEKSNGKAKIIIFTFQNALVKYTKSLMSEKLGENAVTVKTVDSYCKEIYCEMAKVNARTKIENIDKEFVSNVIDLHQRKTLLDHRLYDKDIEFWIDEFNWIRGKCIESKKEYLEADRKGRGSQVKVFKNDREIIWGVYEVLLAEMRKTKRIDWYEIYIYLNRYIDNIPNIRKVDYVFVDEAQDMTVGKMRVLKALAKKSITIAADAAQKIYKSSFTWREVGIDVTGNSSKSLSKSFRSTKQIVCLAEDLMDANRKNATPDDEYTPAVMPEAEGAIPKLYICRDIYTQNGYMCELIDQLKQTEKTIGVIVHTNKELETVKKTLYKKGIRYEFVDPSKDDWNILKPGVKLVKAHSSKGLEFDIVIIPYLTDDVYPYKPQRVEKDAMEEYLRIERSVLYVAMTRARETLVMLSIKGHESRFVDSFKVDHYEVVKR